MGLNTSHANRGKALETTIMASQGRLVRVRKMLPGAKFIGGGEMVRVKGIVDFAGTVCGNGRGLFFDAKQNANVKRFPIRGQLHPHQRDYLLEQGGAGAVAGLLLEATALRKFFWLGWEHLKREEPSIGWEDPRLVELGDSFHVIRFERVPGVVAAVKEPEVGALHG